MRPKNAIGKTLSSSPSFRSNPIRTITGPMIRRQKSSRQVGVCGSALEHAPVPRKTSRIRRSRSRRLKRPLAPARRSAAVCGGLGSRAKKEPKKAYRDFQAIRRKGVVQGQSRQALMSWRPSPPPPSPPPLPSPPPPSPHGLWGDGGHRSEVIEGRQAEGKKAPACA